MTHKTHSSPFLRKIQKHMCHSTATCEAFCQQTDNSVAVSSKRTIEQIMMARHFTQEESSVVTKEYPLNEEATPSLGICDQIVQKHKLNKTKKHMHTHTDTKSHKRTLTHVT